MIKYCLFGDYVYSKDKQEHWVSAGELIRLYNVNAEDCMFAPKNTKGWRVPESLICLYPMSNGDYTLPQDKTNPS